MSRNQEQEKASKGQIVPRLCVSVQLITRRKKQKAVIVIGTVVLLLSS